MNILLLSAGLGTRLGEITKTTPKCLLPINSKPILGIWIDKLTDLKSIGNIYVNTHYHAEMVSTYLNSNHQGIKILHEPVLLGTFGTIYKNIQIFKNSDLLVVHTDLFSSIDLPDYIESAQNIKSNQLHIGVFKPKNFTGCGIFKINDNKVISFKEKPKSLPKLSREHYANAAIYLFKQKLMSEIDSEKFESFKDIANDFLPKILPLLSPYFITGYHIDIGTIDNYLYANSLHN